MPCLMYAIAMHFPSFPLPEGCERDRAARRTGFFPIAYRVRVFFTRLRLLAPSTAPSLLEPAAGAVSAASSRAQRAQNDV